MKYTPKPKKRRDYKIWHRWFAWFPLKTQDGTWVWLETIWRRFDGLTIDYIEVWNYRINLPEGAEWSE
jgi:hypothetical protein